MIEALRAHLDMDVAFVSRQVGGTHRIFTHVAARKALATLDPAHPERFIAINVSPETLASPALGQIIPEGLASRLVIELHQQDTAAEPEKVRAAIEVLKERARVAVSSEGLGFAGLQALVDLGPDIVKIAPEFLAGVAADASRRALVKALVQFAADTGVTLIAQGVDTREDLQALRKLGVRFAQGDVLGKPVAPGRGVRVC